MWFTACLKTTLCDCVALQAERRARVISPIDPSIIDADKALVAGGYGARRPLLELPLDSFEEEDDHQEDETRQAEEPIAEPEAQDKTALFAVAPEDVRVDREIGKGAFSVVYAGEYRGTAVAVKCQPKGDEGQIPPYVVSEIEMATRLSHPQLLQFMGAADLVEDQQVWILTEYSDNGDVEQLLSAVRDGERPHPGWRALARIALDAAEGLRYLQTQHVVHRDVKTVNLLLNTELRAKLCDFGFATDRVAFSTDRAAATSSDADDNEESKAYCGTDAYMAPEMFLGEAYDERVDIFSFGVMLMEMLCCRTPSDNGFLLRLPQLKFAIALSEFHDALPSSCPPELEQLAAACVAFEPTNRPDIDEVVCALQGLLDNEAYAASLATAVELRPFTAAQLEPQLVAIYVDDDSYDSNSDSDSDDEDEDMLEHGITTPPTYCETPTDLDDDMYLWLKRLGCQHYAAVLRSKGFSTIDFIRETGIEKEDLNFLGIRDPATRWALMDAARTLQAQA